MNVYIGLGAQAYKNMFLERGWGVVNNIEDADLVQFVGGADVSPELYGEKRHPNTYSQSHVDEADIATFKKAKTLGIPMAGICRGAQFLHVMNGGHLWQHVNGHAIPQGHMARDLATGELIMVTSTHHQMMDSSVGELLMVAEGTENTFKEFVDTEGAVRGGTDVEVEAVLHSKTNSLCYQPHPEMCRKESPCQEMYFEYLEMVL